jgi:hypothetical protein
VTVTPFMVPAAAFVKLCTVWAPVNPSLKESEAIFVPLLQPQTHSSWDCARELEPGTAQITSAKIAKRILIVLGLLSGHADPAHHGLVDENRRS